MVNYEEWIKTVPQEIKGDSLWKVTAYRLALFLGDLGWQDVTKLMKDRRTIGLADQLYRALGSISGNIEEEYFRGAGKDRARFYEYSLGSARESRGWYYRGRYILGEAVLHHRLQLLSEIIRLLLTMVPQQRGYVIRDETAPYLTGMNTSEKEISINENLDYLLKNVPLPPP
jgi:four helix bundle protein